MDYDVGGKIRERRNDLGLTQEQLGARAGMTKLTISRYEGGKRKPGFDELTILSVALEVSPAYFWSGKRSMVPQRVRALIQAGFLDAEKFGRDWHVDAGSVEKREKVMEQKKREP